MGEHERTILDYVDSQKTPEFQARQREMVAAINTVAMQKPVRFQKCDVVLYVTSEYQLQARMEEGFLVAYLPQGHEAYEIDARELEHVYARYK